MIETISNSSSLTTRLRERIKSEGAITFCDWMKAALYDPDDGYYCRADRTRWGRQGDYRTSPERTSLFAASFARYFAKLYHQLGEPSEWTIVEAGAGVGQFAEALLQTLQEFFPNIFTATRYTIDEISLPSGTMARDRLRPFADRVHFGKLADIEIDPGVVFANELLDAFPVHRLTMQEGELKEFYVTVGEHGTFEWQLAAPHRSLMPRFEAYFEEFGVSLAEGQVAEVNLEIEEWLRKVAARLRTGYLITVDYGAESEDLYSSAANQEGTLRGFRRHQFVANLLAQPGEHDLTTTVNWSFVKLAGRRCGFELVEFERQDRFLLSCGLLEQLQVETSRAASESERLRLTTGAREMIFPDGMAASFQVLVQKKI